MNALTCFQGQTVKLFAHFVGSTWFEAWDSHPPRPSGALCNWVSAFGVPLALGMGWNREGRAVSIAPWDDHCFPKNHAGGQGRLKGGLQPDCTMHSPLITTDIFKVLRADIATSPTSVSLTQLPHQFRKNRPRLSPIFFWSPISSMRVAGR